MSQLEVITWSGLTAEQRRQCLIRPAQKASETLVNSVRIILDDVKARGDEAILDMTEKWDQIRPQSLRITRDELESATIDAGLSAAINACRERIERFHIAQKPQDICVETAPGVLCEKRFLPINRVGLYIPGGSAPLPSTVLMLAVPAMVAGCKEIALVTPPGRDGKIAPVILAAARMVGVDEIYMCGGAQAIGALSFGTQTIARVDKIFGPGNAFVTEAKIQVSVDPSGCPIDLPAGPSEVMVIADDSADAVFVAADLLSQAEHDPSSQVILLSTSLPLIEAVRTEIDSQLANLPRREIARQSLTASRLILVGDLNEAMRIANQYAPEHLLLQTRDARLLSAEVQNAGSVFIGNWTPEAAGDYGSGTNHVLPTYGFAKSLSGVGTESFMKAVSVQELSPDGLNLIGTEIEQFAEAEGLRAHKNAVTVRLKRLQESPG